MRGRNSDKRHSAIVQDYRAKLSLYEDYASMCRTLIDKILVRRGIRVHSVTSRAKEPEKLGEKLTRPEKRYENMSDVTDLAGVRIITYFADEVDVVSRMIEAEFDVIVEESIDKRQLLDPDRFGYLSMHYVCKFPRRRYQLEEYALYEGLVCEIQIRSILQHAWAEIEHDLGYKAQEGIPRQIRRRFSRLAGQLETADDEFIRIRDELAKYESEVNERIQSADEEISVDKVSLAAFIEKDGILRAIDEELAEYDGAQLQRPSSDSLSSLTQHVQDAGLGTLREVREALSTRRDAIVRQWKSRFTPTGGTLNRGISLYHLWQVLKAEQGREALEHAFTAFTIPVEPEDINKLLEVAHASRGER